MKTADRNLEAFHDEVESILTYMSLSNSGRGNRAAERIDIRYFDGAYPTGEAVLKALDAEPVTDPQVGGQPTDVFLRGATPSLVTGPVNFAWVTDRSKGPSRGSFKYGLCRIRQVSAKDARGRLVRHCESNYLATIALIDDGGCIRNAASHYGGFAAGRWYPERTPGHEFNKVIVDEYLHQIRIGIALQASCENDWRVLIGWENSPRVMFTTDPLGVREVFRLRDIPNGASRRSALRHWVTDHWRRTGEEKRSEVRAHLRGSVEFSWGGLRCKIVPSAADRMRNAEPTDVEVLS